MNNKRFENDEKLNYVYEVLNKAKFRNYIYVYDEKVNYCDYIDEYETAIDDRNDKITKLEQALDEIEKYLKNDIESCNSALSNPEYTIISKHELLKNEKRKDIDMLKIIQKAKGDVKNENN